MLKEKEIEIKERQPSFYTILPSSVRYCKELSYFEMILYSEIVARTNKKGYCWTSNKTFASLYECTERKISSAISHLIKLNFLKSSVSNFNGKVYRILELYEVAQKKQAEEEPKKNKQYKNKKVVAVPTWYDDYQLEMKAKAEQEKKAQSEEPKIDISELYKKVFAD